MAHKASPRHTSFTVSQSSFIYVQPRVAEPDGLLAEYKSDPGLRTSPGIGENVSSIPNSTRAPRTSQKLEAPSPARY
jgi:hypothetical protein